MRPRPHRRNRGRIDKRHMLRVILLDMPEICRILELRVIVIQVLHPVVQDRVIVADGAEVALEVLHVDGVEADEGGVGADVELCHLGAEEVGAFAGSGEFLQFVEGGEGAGEGFLVGFLVGGEAGFVDASVEVGLHPLFDAIDGWAVLFGVESQVGEIFWQEAVEGGAEIAEEFMGLGVDDGFQLLVPKNRHSVFAFVVRVGFKVQLAQESCPVEGLFGGVLVGRLAFHVEAPALVAFRVRLDDADTNVGIRIQLLKMQHQVCPVCKWAEETNVEMVAPLVWRERSISGDLAVKGVFRPIVP